MLMMETWKLNILKPPSEYCSEIIVTKETVYD